jgi:hypothetical protein
MITDEQAQRIYDAMVDIWGDNLPHPEHEPRRAEYYMKMFSYCHPNRLQEALNGNSGSTQS